MYHEAVLYIYRSNKFDSKCIAALFRYLVFSRELGAAGVRSDAAHNEVRQSITLL